MTQDPYPTLGDPPPAGAPIPPGSPSPYGPPAPYGQPPGASPGYYAGAYPPGAHPRPDEMNWAGTASLVLALTSPLISLLPFISLVGPIILVVSAVLGLIGMSAARNGRATNRGMALAGLIISVGLIVLGVLVIITLVGLAAMSQQSSY
ncbi:hypothetical protein NSA19_03015 [Actinomyces bowdenii]|uniref:DUF4190 domain-containing protein n=1 Tax=Actinomyces bowdenii TaxID=131109 RepID=UPI00214B4ADD|nr:DUF4190 domain-containing protein [Actinomyces bowdenii]MCR2051840.1 hypothetical protein [Actinomyces bowdenii]